MHFKQDTALPPFYPLPQFLLARKLTANAKILYALLLSRTQLSQRSGWVGEDGSVYIIYTVRQMAQALGCSVRSVSSALRELEREGLLRRLRRGITKANLLYLLLPDDAQTPAACDRESGTDGRRLVCLAGFEEIAGDRQTSAAQDAQDPAGQGRGDGQLSSSPDGQLSSTPDGQKTSGHVWQDFPTSKKDRDNRPTHKKGELTARLPYGAHQNVFLSGDEFKFLRSRCPKGYIHYIEKLSRHIAVYGDSYTNHCGTILRMLEDDEYDGNRPEDGYPLDM